MKTTDPEFRPDDGLTAEGAAAEGAKATPPERPEWLPSQFESPEALAKSYEESRKEMNRLQERQAQSEREFADALQAVQAEQEQRSRQIDPATDPRLRAYQDAVDAGDATTQLAIQLDLTRQMIEAGFNQTGSQMQPQMQALQAAQRDQQIDMAEQQAATYARQQGLDYDASRQDVIDVLRSHYGDQLLPLTGDVPTYAGAIRNAVDVVTAKALVQDIQSGERDRREKLSAMTTTPGASGRTATGAPEEGAEWKKITDSADNSWAGISARAQRA